MGCEIGAEERLRFKSFALVEKRPELSQPRIEGNRTTRGSGRSRLEGFDGLPTESCVDQKEVEAQIKENCERRSTTACSGMSVVEGAKHGKV
jgi:hypothetical protein